MLIELSDKIPNMFGAHMFVLVFRGPIVIVKKTTSIEVPYNNIEFFNVITSNRFDVIF